MYLNTTFTPFPEIRGTLIPDYILIPLCITALGVCSQCVIVSGYCLFWSCCVKKTISTKDNKQTDNKPATPLQDLAAQPSFAHPLFLGPDSPTFTRETPSEFSNTHSPQLSPVLTFTNKNTVGFHKSADSLTRESPFSTANSREHWI